MKTPVLGLRPVFRNDQMVIYFYFMPGNKRRLMFLRVLSCLATKGGTTKKEHKEKKKKFFFSSFQFFLCPVLLDHLLKNCYKVATKYKMQSDYQGEGRIFLRLSLNNVGKTHSLKHTVIIQ